MATSMSSGVRQTPKKGKKKKKITWLAVLATVMQVLLICGGICFVGMGILRLTLRINTNQSFKDLSDGDFGISTQADADTGITNIALFGVDSRNVNSFRGLSDCIMVLSVDTTHHCIKLTSFLRDSLVYIDGHYPNKINSAYSFGGPELAIKTLNTNFNLNIRDYATVNLAGMADIIDAMGGIDAEMTDSEVAFANKHMRSLSKEAGTPYDPIKKSGKVHLNGIQAANYARIRKTSTVDGQGGDFGRTDRQRYVLEQLFNKVKDLSVSDYPAIIKKLMPYIETSLDYSDILGLAGSVVGGIRLKQERIPNAKYVIDADYRAATGSSTVYYNLDYATEIVHAFIYDDIAASDYMAEHPVKKTEWFNK